MIFYSKDLDILEVKINKYCNLKCIACGTFSNLAQHEDYPVEQMKEDLQRIKQFYP